MNTSRQELEEQLGVTIPDCLIAFWEAEGGEKLIGDCVVIYGPDGIVERNVAFGFRERVPGYLLFASDSGPMVALLKAEREARDVFVAHWVILSLEALHATGEDFATWIANDCQTGFFEEDTLPYSAVTPVDVLLSSEPPGGAAKMIAIRNAFAANRGIREFILATKTLPLHLGSSGYLAAVHEIRKVGISDYVTILETRTGVPLPVDPDFEGLPPRD